MAAGVFVDLRAFHLSHHALEDSDDLRDILSGVQANVP